MQKMTDQTIENAEILWEETGSPYSSRFDDIYFSRQGGLEETEHVFIAANRLVERWQMLDATLQMELNSAARAASLFTVAELGFGTGLNFLCCWRTWQQTAARHLRLHYIACEKYPMQKEALRRALAQWPELKNFSASLLEAYLDHSAGYHRLHLLSQDKTSEITLDLYYGDAATRLAEQPSREQVKVDAWFLDGFAPRVNPDMWSPELLHSLAYLSRPGTSLSTYSVAGQVVRTLQQCGFNVSKQPGFGQKRHMLHGMFAGANPIENKLTGSRAWLQLPATGSNLHEVIIIGGGMAGCSVAYSLARRGYRVTLLEQNAEIANGASGNRQAVLQCRLSNAVNAGWQFNLQSFLYSSRHFNALQAEAPELHWQPCGVLNLDTAFSSRREHCEDVRLECYSPQVVHRLNQNDASARSGVNLDGGGNFLPLGGWLNPAALCRLWLENPLITLRTSVQVDRLEYYDHRWQIFTRNAEKPQYSAPIVVVANSHAAKCLAQTRDLPLVPLRGQVSYVQESTISSRLSCVVCGLSYISPAQDGLHSAGASYSKDIRDLSITEKEHRENIDGICSHLPQGAVTGAAVSGGRVSVRAATTDRMPIVGPVPDFSALENLYNALGQRQRRTPEVTMPWLQNLYLSVGHGSHGLSNTPLAGEYIASLIGNEPSPLSQAVAECLHPARFALRKLRKLPVTR